MPDEADRDADRRWWEQTWTEREDALWDAFGPSHPPGASEGDVLSFPFDRVPLPGACCYVFPPSSGDDRSGRREHREHWLYVTHGLAQWLRPGDLRSARAAGKRESGTGAEFGIITDAAAAWAPGLLMKIMSIDHESRTRGARPFERGDRVPFYFESIRAGEERWAIGGMDGPVTTPVDATRALMFWPYLSRFGTFTTGTGTFEIRVATMITASEWALAQETSSCHLLLLLDWAGVGQRCRPGRPSVTERPGWDAQWAAIAEMPFEEAKDALRRIAQKEQRT